MRGYNCCKDLPSQWGKGYIPVSDSGVNIRGVFNFTLYESHKNVPKKIHLPIIHLPKIRYNQNNIDR